MFRRSTYVLAGVVFIGACGENSTAPDPELTAEDAEFLVQLVDATTMAMFDDIFGSSTTGPDGAPARTHEPVVWTRTFERSRPCHEGGDTDRRREWHEYLGR